MDKLITNLTFLNMQHNFPDFKLSYGSDDEALKAMSRIYPAELMPALREWVVDTRINFEGGE